MDGHGHLVTAREFSDVTQEFIGDGERCVNAEHSLDLGRARLLDLLDEALTLSYSSGAFSVRSPLGGLECDCPPNAGLLDGGCDAVEHPRHRIGARECVGEKSCAGPDELEAGDEGASVGILSGHRLIHWPPYPLQNLREIRRGLDIERGASKQHAIKVSVRADQTRHDYFSFCVDGLLGLSLRFEAPTDFDYATIFNRQRTIRDYPSIFIHRDDQAIFYQKVDQTPTSS